MFTVGKANAKCCLYLLDELSRAYKYKVNPKTRQIIPNIIPTMPRPIRFNDINIDDDDI